MRTIKYLLIFMMFGVTSDLLANTCRFNSTPMNFGMYYPMQKNRLDITGTIEIDCRGRRGTYEITASTGQSGDYQYRYMLNGQKRLRYNLFTNASRSLIWGDGTSNTTIFSGYHDGGRTREVLDIHGYIHAEQDADPGVYNDFITVTATF